MQVIRNLVPLYNNNYYLTTLVVYKWSTHDTAKNLFQLT